MIGHDHLNPDQLYQAHVARRNQHLRTRPNDRPDWPKIIARDADVEGLRSVQDGGRFVVHGVAGDEDGGLQVIVSPA